MEVPKFSVIIPVFNADQYLSQCVESLIKSDFDSYEIILVDDGSTDGSAVMCDDFAAKNEHIKVIHKSNEGVSIARNLGLDMCKGEYVVFVDADDWATEDYWNVLNKECGSADIVFFGMRKIHETGFTVTYQSDNFYSDIREEIENECQRLIDNDTFCSLYGFTWIKVFRNELIQKNNVRFISGQTHYEDELFTNMYMLGASSMKVISDVIYNYRWKLSGLSFGNKQMNQYISMADALLEDAKFAKTKKYELFLKKRAWNNVLEAFQRTSGLKGKVSAAKILKEYSKKAGVKYPRISVSAAYLREIIKRG